MTKSPPSGPAHPRCVKAFALAILTLCGWAPSAQEAPAAAPAPIVQEAPLPVVDPAFLEPLTALAGDETAFVDQLWMMGNAQFERLDTLGAEIALSTNASDVQAKRNEMRACVAKLQAIAGLGLKTFDHNARVHNFNGTVFYDALGRPLDGVKEWLAAVSLDSGYSDPYNNLGMHYFHAGDYTLGFQNMDKALELEPKNPDYCFNMAQNYLIYRPQTEKHRGWDAEKVYKEAMKLSRKATKLAPEDYEILEDYAVNFLAAENFGVKPDWKEATKAWVAARERANTPTQTFFTWLNEGRAWRDLGNKKEAKRCFEQALALLPGNEATTRLLNEVSAE